MSEARASGIVVGEYVYNGKGERVKKTAGGKTTVFHYDARGQLIAESDEAGATLREYVYLEGAPLALLTPTSSGGIEVIVDNADPGFDAFSDWESKTNGTGAEGGEYVRQRTNGPAAGGILADDGAATLTGRWRQRLNRNAIGSDFHRARAGPGDATAAWSIAVPAPGDYRVYATWRSIKGVASDVPYTIAHSGGATTLVVDQTQNNNRWVELGLFSFAAETISVSLQNTPNGKAVADAIYVVDASATAGHHATWKLDAPESGDYEVYVRWPADVPGAARKAEFTVDHAGGNDTFVVNQRVGGNQWNLLGVFSFAAGAGEVTLGDEGRRRHVLADAVRIVKSGPTSGPAQVFYYHNDHLGTPNRMTNVDGTVVWAADYEPFGQTMLSVTAVSTNLRFPGQYFDTETGLHYNYFRDYDPTLGRYVQSDPIGLAGGINSFSYSDASPIRLLDRFGLSAIAVFVRPTPIVVRPIARPRPSIEQRPGESIGQFTRRLEQGIRNRAQNGIPRVTKDPLRLPRQAPAPGGDILGGFVRLISNLRQFLRDLSEFNDLGGAGGSPVPIPIAPAPLSGFAAPKDPCPPAPKELPKECYELGLCV
jgi:RHS repeat-associated protein